MNYSGQTEEAEKSYRTKDEKSDGKDSIPMSKAEFLSGFRKEDRLMPVISLVVHQVLVPGTIRKVLQYKSCEPLMKCMFLELGHGLP